MISINGDRRRAKSYPSFPLTDSEGSQVLRDRRSGQERRKNKRRADVAGKILNILN